MNASKTDHPHFITSDEELKRICQQWKSEPALALDTEFIRTDTFYSIVGLIQVADSGGCFLIDPLEINDFSPFAEVLADTNVIKVLHSCSEDLELFSQLVGALPVPLFDSQIGAALDGYGFSMSYQRLVEAVLNVHVPKGETRSNWLQRPLTESQIHYAALDVEHLLTIFNHLKDSLTEKNRYGWWQAEGDVLIARYSAADNTEDYYKKVKSAWKLSSQQLAVLKALTSWRELKARERNKPRNRIVKDRSCFDLAMLQPTQLKALSSVQDVGPGIMRRDGETLLSIIKSAVMSDSEDYPATLPKPLPPATGALLKTLKAHVKQRAEQLGLAPEMLARKRDYEALLRSGFPDKQYTLPETLSGWRQVVIGDELLKIVQKG
jgi:ribonuclease D